MRTTTILRLAFAVAISVAPAASALSTGPAPADDGGAATDATDNGSRINHNGTGGITVTLAHCLPG